jgi:hypothetical protein
MPIFGPRSNEHKNLDTDDFDMEKTIDGESENLARHDSVDSRRKFTDDENNYNLEDQEVKKDPEHDFVPIDEIPSDDDNDPAEHLGEVDEEGQEEGLLNEIVRKPKGFKDKNGVFHSTEPIQVFKPGDKEATILKHTLRISPDQREELIRKAKKEQHQKEAIEWLEKHNTEVEK